MKGYYFPLVSSWYGNSVFESSNSSSIHALFCFVFFLAFVEFKFFIKSNKMFVIHLNMSYKCKYCWFCKDIGLLD